jgi:hypothetical protein
MECSLCERCQSFQLEPRDFVGNPDWLDIHNSNEYLDLGFAKDVLDRAVSCSLCRLVVLCLDLSNPKCPIENEDGSFTTCCLYWKGGSSRWNRVLGMEETPILLNPKMRDVGEEHEKNYPLSRCFLTPMAEDMQALGAESLTYYARAPAQTQESLELIKTWLRGCLQFHGRTCDHSVTATSTPRLRTFSVIDVEEGRLVEIRPSQRYFTLSYVWGAQPFFETKKDNVESLREVGGLNRIRCNLPKTVTDAMDLLLGIGETYLWVDRLCIVQDDAKTKHSLIANMDEVFGLSFATIIARSGENADAGLFGTHPWHKAEKVMGDVRLVSVVDFSHDQNLGMAPIQERAWT